MICENQQIVTKCNMNAHFRHQYILDHLAQHGRVEISELEQSLGVSAMTVHRDLDALAQAGRLRKVRGGALLVSADQDPAPERCVGCYGPVTPRTQVVLHLHDGSQRRACCPHCGLMALGRLSATVQSLLITDFLTGRMVNGRDAVYLAAPELAVCCTPSVLSFEDRKNAERFQAGFGGSVMTLDEALAFVHQSMHLAS